MTKLACNHCRHLFELETLAGAVCPSCGWSSSVVLESDFQSTPEIKSKEKKASSAPHWFLGFIFFCIKVMLLIAVIAAIVFGVRFFLKHQGEQASMSKSSASLKLGGLFSKKEAAAPTIDIKKDAVIPAAIGLNNKEQESLLKAFDVSEEAVLSDQDLKLLQRSVDLKTELVEKLPSSSWKVEEFKEYIEAQELKFKIPLPRGYKKDLTSLFEKTYATAYDLFLKGQLKQARDAYVASLAFPIYANDLRKHRAVVLTMMRGFLNDTIAKIGALNFALARQGSQLPSEQVSLEYIQFQNLIRSEQWVAALDSLKKIEGLLPEDLSGSAVSYAPPYGQEFSQIDSDIQPSLNRLLQVPAWPFDVNALKGDLSVKEMILIPLADPERKVSVQKYREAMDFIREKAWGDAIKKLKEVKSPEELVQNADDKVRLIERLVEAEKSSVNGA